MAVPIIINCRDRLDPLLKLVEWLERSGQQEIILLDNDSGWPPLLDYYRSTPHEVVRLQQNLGSQAPWHSGLVDGRFRKVPYAVTDPDVVPAEECPSDLLDYLADLLSSYPERRKIGVGLKIDDIPDHYRHAVEVRAMEQSYWTHPISAGLYDAPVDTTLAVYRPGLPFGMDRSLRTGAPYIARHLTWYMDNSNPTDEEQWYAANASFTTWASPRLSRFSRQLVHLNVTQGKGFRAKLIRVERAALRAAVWGRAAYRYHIRRRP